MPPVIGLAAFSGSGKTTLARRLIELLVQRGFRIGVIKHAHHDFDIDQPGKDSYELRKAGAEQTLISSRRRRALITEMGTRSEPALPALISELDPGLDLIVVEGFKHSDIPKLEIRRLEARTPALAPTDPNVIAIVTNAPSDPSVSSGLPVLDLDAPERVVEFIVARFLTSTGSA